MSELNHRIIIYKPDVNTNPDTDVQSEIYSEYKRLWSKKQGIHMGSLFYAAQRENSTQDVTFIVRKRTDITLNMRIVDCKLPNILGDALNNWINSNAYYIKSIPDYDDKRNKGFGDSKEYMQIIATRIQPTGGD